MAKSFNRFDDIARAIRPACKLVVKKTALDCQANIQGQIVANDQVDTGFMLNSVYTVTSEGSSYKGGSDALSPISGPSSELEAFVAVAAHYGHVQNYGSSFQPGRPFFEPGVERTRPGFEAALNAIVEKMRRAAQE